MTTASTCKEQSCSEKIRADHFLCREHWQKSQEGVINECPQCGTYKDAKYPLCIECNKKSTAESRSTGKETSKATANPQRARRYDPPKADTFAERTALLDDDQKAKDKRQLFHDQRQKCIYCGNVYRYDELEIEHIIPKALGGPDNIRNCQLACKTCNQAKGTMTDIEFRQKHAGLLPQEERTPADPPIKPTCSKLRYKAAFTGGSNASKQSDVLLS